MHYNLTALTYHGNVKVKLKINGKLYEVEESNEGLNYLKYIFAVFISGNDVGTSYSPQYIDLRKEYTDEELQTFESSYLNYFSSVTGKRYYEDNNEWYAEFTSVISSDQLLQTVLPDDSSNYYLYLMTDYDEENTVDKQHDLAKLPITAKTLSQITPGITATIVWSMKLTNA